MNRVYSLVTCAFFGYVAYTLAIHHGTRWEFGAYGLPQPLLAADGRHYRDGTDVEPAIRQLVAADLVVEVQLVVYTLGALWFAAMVRYCRRINDNQRLLEAARAGNANLDWQSIRQSSYESGKD
ncbi:MAG: hypothetical protein JNK76_09035 [Planctomycetales bacterium]|nr:hypothetical protein [Planctomycetales bacterium]MBN8627756.1 hypothetical protein [Planctomycetota bacterium]